MAETPSHDDPIELTRAMLTIPPGPWTPRLAVDIFGRWLAPAVVWESVGLSARFDGVDASREYLGVWLGRFEDYEIEIAEIVELGSGVVFTKSSHRGRLLGSPADAWQPRETLAHSFVWEQGLITHVVSSPYTPEARPEAERLAESRA